jgi:hypothetical protein
MTRSEALAIMNKHLDRASDETLAAAAERLEAMADDFPSGDEIAEPLSSASWLPRPLTAQELALIEQSKEDFRLGRTYTLEETRKALDDSLENLGVPRSSR